MILYVKKLRSLSGFCGGFNRGDLQDYGTIEMQI